MQCAVPKACFDHLVSSEAFDLCEISDQLFISYSTFQSEEINFGNYSFDMCCVT